MRRTRSIITAAAVLGGIAALPAAASAAVPTIAASPNPTTAGDPVVIFGTATPGTRVRLWHRINPAARFTPLGSRVADAAGRYEFDRADGVVTTNRNWYVVDGGQRSATVNEKVSALVTVTGPTGSNLVTGARYTFSGSVSPSHKGARVLLQRQSASGDGQAWTTIDSGRVGASGYAIVHRFRAAGDANLRVLLPADRRNLASGSDVLGYQVSEKQNAKLSLVSSADPLAVGGSATLSGQVTGATAPEPVTLYARVAGGRFAPVATATTDATGAYAFPPVAPIVSTYYQVRTSALHSAVLFEGVGDVITASASATTVVAGTTVTFTGTVAPDKSGHVILLQRQDPTGSGWHTVQTATVGAGSTISIARRLTVAGAKAFRLKVPGGPRNQAGVSQAFPITVTPNATPLA